MGFFPLVGKVGNVYRHRAVLESTIAMAVVNRHEPVLPKSDPIRTTQVRHG